MYLNPRARAYTFLLAALTAMTALSIDMNLPALPQLQKTFATQVSQVQLTLSLFMLGFGFGQVFCGPLSDRFGRRPVLLHGLSVFTLAGLGCAFSHSLAVLVALRFVQGMGASAGRILSLALVRDHFEREEATAILSHMTQVMMIAPLVAPTLGGYLLLWFGWQAIFIVLGLSGALLWLACWRSIAEPRRHADSQAQASGVWKDALSVTSHRDTMLNVLIVSFAGSGMFAYISGSPFVYTDVFNVPRHHFGYYFGLTSLCLMIGAGVNRACLSRCGSQELLRRGIWVIAAAGIALVTLTQLHAGLAGIVVPMMVYLFGMGLVMPNATAAAIAPHGQAAGMASSVIGGVQTVASAFSAYLVGAFYNRTPASLVFMVLALCLCSVAAYLASRARSQAG